MAPWIAANLGKKVTMIFPDYAFGYDHRDYFSAGDEGAGRRGRRADRHPADRDLLHPLLPADPGRDRGASTTSWSARRCSPSSRSSASSTAPAGRRSSASSTRSRPSTSPAPASSSSTARHFWEGSPALHAGRRQRAREVLPRAVGVDDNGAARRRRQGRLDLRRTCSAAGRRSSSSSRRWRPPATRARTTAPSWSRRPRR